MIGYLKLRPLELDSQNGSISSDKAVKSGLHVLPNGSGKGIATGLAFGDFLSLHLSISTTPIFQPYKSQRNRALSAFLYR